MKESIHRYTRVDFLAPGTNPACQVDRAAEPVLMQHLGGFGRSYAGPAVTLLTFEPLQDIAADC